MLEWKLVGQKNKTYMPSVWLTSIEHNFGDS